MVEAESSAAFLVPVLCSSYGTRPYVQLGLSPVNSFVFGMLMSPKLKLNFVTIFSCSLWGPYVIPV